MQAWIATHTGLPCFYLPDPVRITAGTRVIADVQAGPVLVSDPLAEPGVPTTYTVGAQVVTLTRKPGLPGNAILTDSSGRGIELLYVDTGDPREYTPDVALFNPYLASWSLLDPAYAGSGIFTLKDLTKRDLVERILRVHEPVIIAPASPTPGMNLQRGIVTQVRRTRYAAGSRMRFEVSWRESRLSERQSCGAPVVTWGEYASASGGKWTDETYLEICERIAGMPATPSID